MRSSKAFSLAWLTSTQRPLIKERPSALSAGFQTGGKAALQE